MSETDASLRQRLLIVLAGAAFLAASGLGRLLRPAQPELADALAAAGALVMAAPILRDALASLRASGFAATKFYMDQYITLAVAACFAAGRYTTAGVVAGILILGQLLEERSVVGVREAIGSLTRLARVRTRRLTADGAEEEVDAADLRPGDRVRLRPGDAVPADGVVRAGMSSVNQASITGESLPVDVAAGSEVFAGTQNLDGALEVEILRTGDETVFGRVRQIIGEAEQSRAPLVRLTEEYARFYTPLVLVLAAAVFFFTRDLDRAISVIIVSIPCAFVLASPAAMVAALAAASRLGILVKSVRAFEAAAIVDTAVMDKTGTLTRGVLTLAGVDPLPGVDPARAQALAAALGRLSAHPVARALAAAPGELPPPEARDAAEHPGRGVEGRVEGRRIRLGRAAWLAADGVALPAWDPPSDGASETWLAEDDTLLARLRLRDTPRPEARAAVEALRGEGITRVVMLTGDRPGAAQAVSAHAGLDGFESSCLPADKLARVQALAAEGRAVLVVGDGINDAPALAGGTLGVAMGALGSDVAVRAADVALMTSDLRRLATLVQLARRTVATVNQNLLIGFALIVLSVTLSMGGWVSPVFAAVLHETSAFFVIFNSARLLRFEASSEDAEDVVVPVSPPLQLVAS